MLFWLAPHPQILIDRRFEPLAHLAFWAAICASSFLARGCKDPFLISLQRTLRSLPCGQCAKDTPELFMNNQKLTDGLGHLRRCADMGNPVEGERDSGLKPNTIPL